jgi:hypothetical protein
MQSLELFSYHLLRVTHSNSRLISNFSKSSSHIFWCPRSQVPGMKPTVVVGSEKKVVVIHHPDPRSHSPRYHFHIIAHHEGAPISTLCIYSANILE